MTIKATWSDGVVMMFGDSYRDWDDQLGEYCRMTNRTRPVIMVSRTKWVGFGGLKWCSKDNFQEQLNKEGKGRESSSFKFSEPSNRQEQKLNRIFT